MLEFKNVTARENALKTIGTVASFVGVGGYHELASDKNFKDAKKRVSIRLVNSKGQQTYVNCSVPLSAELRESKGVEELKTNLAKLASLPILELPQTDEEGNPVMVVDEETGEEKPLVLYSISYQGSADMSSTRTIITDAMIKEEASKRVINFEDLIAI